MNEQERADAIRQAIQPIRDQQEATKRAAEEERRVAEEAKRRDTDLIIGVEAKASRFSNERIKPIVRQLQDLLGGGVLVARDDISSPGVQGQRGWGSRMAPNIDLEVAITFHRGGATLQVFCTADGHDPFVERYNFSLDDFDETALSNWLDKQMPEAAKYIAENREQTN